MIKKILQKKNIFFLFAFVLAKATVFLTPILIAESLSKADYGVLEYALAGLGMLVSAAFGLGVAGAYPYFILKKKELSIENGFVLHPFWLVFLLILNQIVYYLFQGYAIEYYMAINVAYLISNQMFYSTQLKSHEINTKAVLVDAGLYIVLLTSLGFGLMTKSISIELFNKSIQFYTVFYVVYAVYKYFKTEHRLITTHYKKILKYSVHLLLSSFLLFAITVSGRMTVKEFIGDEAAGIYGYYFRIAAIVVMIHSIISILFFKKIYTLDPKVLDKYYAMFLAFIFTTSLVVFWVAPYILPDIFDFFKDTYQPNKWIFFILSTQMVLWIATALLSNIITRENLLKKNNILLVVISTLGVLYLFIMRKQLSIFSLSIFHYIIFMAAALAQIRSLYVNKIYFSRTLVVLLGTFTISAVFLYFGTL
ncbi:MAG TPA: hypothetical protein EYG92_10505 [Lutibacter sp.]|nr:hypothetical protein [Lutibacter sp.]